MSSFIKIKFYHEAKSSPKALKVAQACHTADGNETLLAAILATFCRIVIISGKRIYLFFWKIGYFSKRSFETGNLVLEKQDLVILLFLK